MARKQQDGILGYKAIRSDINTDSCRKLYVFFGDETFLLYHYVEALKKHLIDPITESFNLHQFNQENFSIDAFLDAVDNLPMMAEHSMIILEDIDFFSAKEDDRERITVALNDIPEYCTIICTYLTSAWKPDKRKKKLWDAINENGSVVEFGKQDAVDLVPWIERRFRDSHKQITAELCRHLLEMTDGTMTMLQSEISKICAFSCSDEICVADIDTVVEPVIDIVVFQMTDMISLGQYDSAMEMLNSLMKQQDALTILGAIGASFRRMYAAKVLSDKGKTYYELSRLYNLPEYPAKKTMQNAKTLRKKYLTEALRYIVETDWQLKNSLDDKERLLELLIIKLAMESAHG